MTIDPIAAKRFGRDGDAHLPLLAERLGPRQQLLALDHGSNVPSCVGVPLAAAANPAETSAAASGAGNAAVSPALFVPRLGSHRHVAGK